MMIPEPVHNDPRKKVPGSMIYVGDPFRYSASLHGSPGSGRPFYGPVVGGFIVPGENLEKVDRGYPIFLGRISADQIVTFLIKIRHFSTIGVMSHRLQAFRAYHHLFLFTCGSSRFQSCDSALDAGPFRVQLQVKLKHSRLVCLLSCSFGSSTKSE